MLIAWVLLRRAQLLARMPAGGRGSRVLLSLDKEQPARARWLASLVTASVWRPLLRVMLLLVGRLMTCKPHQTWQHVQEARTAQVLWMQTVQGC